MAQVVVPLETYMKIYEALVTARGQLATLGGDHKHWSGPTTEDKIQIAVLDLLDEAIKKATLKEQQQSKTFDYTGG
jgi:hypothetical protein